jgi:hypothetical protein
LTGLRLTGLQDKYKKLFLLAADEVSMWGQVLIGNFVSRLDEVLNKGECAKDDEATIPQHGGVPLFIWWGDQKQLPPVLDAAPFSAESSSKAAHIGHRAYAAINTYLLLDQPMRQDSTSPFMRRLTALRDGPIQEIDVEFWRGRRFLFLPPEEKCLFELYEPGVLYATCLNKERDEINQKYIKGLPDVVVVKALCTGSHATAEKSSKGGLLLKIPRMGYYAVSMMVKLTTNLLPEEGLFNNARGTIVDIIYSLGGYSTNDKTVIPTLIIDFPGYTGPPMSDDDSVPRTWVPVSELELRCDKGCCSRRGLPVVCSKADSIHSLQGVTIGDEKAIKRLLVHWDPASEARWPGIFYVAASRAEGVHNVAINFDVTVAGMSKLCSTDAWKRQDTEVARLISKAKEFREQKTSDSSSFRDGDPERHWGSKFDFATRLKWFIDVAGSQMASSNNPEETKDETRMCLEQWGSSIESSGVLAGVQTP